MEDDSRLSVCPIALADAENIQDLARRAASLQIPRRHATVPLGAAVLSSDGHVFPGSFILGSTCYTTVHAEVAAVVQAISAGSPFLVALALYSSTSLPIGELYPCGTCLQLLADHSLGPELWVVIGSGDAPVWKWTPLSHLLPRPWNGRVFGPKRDQH